MSLSFNNAEKRINDALIFSSFNLTINPGKIVAIQSSVNVREQLLNLLLKKTALTSGELMLNDIGISSSKQQIGFLFLNEGLYERLTVQEMLSFIKDLYQSSKSVDKTIHAVQLDGKRKLKISSLSHSEKNVSNLLHYSFKIRTFTYLRNQIKIWIMQKNRQYLYQNQR